MLHALPFSTPWSMSWLSTIPEALIWLFRPLPSLSVRRPPFTSTRTKVGRVLPACGTLRSHLPSLVHSLIAVIAHSMGFEPSYLPAAEAGAAGYARTPQPSARLRPAA